MSRPILVIEDNELWMKVMEVHLSNLGLSYDHASCKSVAMAKLAVNEYEVVLVDLVIPNGPGSWTYEAGMEIVSWLKENRRETATVVVSHVMDPDVITEALDKGANVFLPKVGLTPAIFNKAIEDAFAYHYDHQLAREAKQSGNELDSCRQLPVLKNGIG